MSYSADGEYLISGSSEGTIKVWHLITKRCIQTLSGHINSVNVVQINKKGTIVSGGADNNICCWQARTGQQPPTFLLRWRTHDKLLVQGCDLGQVTEISSQNKRLMKRGGAIVHSRSIINWFLHTAERRFFGIQLSSSSGNNYADQISEATNTSRSIPRVDSDNLADENDLVRVDQNLIHSRNNSILFWFTNRLPQMMFGKASSESIRTISALPRVNQEGVDHGGGTMNNDDLINIQLSTTNPHTLFGSSLQGSNIASTSQIHQTEHGLPH